MAAHQSNPAISAKHSTTCCSRAASSTSSCWAGREKRSTHEWRLQAAFASSVFVVGGGPSYKRFNFKKITTTKKRKKHNEGAPLLAEKIFFLLETPKKHPSSHGSPP